MPARSLGQHVGRSFRLGLSAPAIGSMASLATVRGADESRPPLDPKTTRPARHDLRRVRVVEHHDRRAGHVTTGVGQEVGWGLGHLFGGAARRGAARALSWRCLLCPASVFWPWGSVARALSALILCQTLCRLRGRCTRPARALPFGMPWGGARGLVGGLDAFLLWNRIGVPWWCEASCMCAWSSTRVVGVP